MKEMCISLSMLLAGLILNGQQTSDFESILMHTDTFWNGSANEGGIRSGGAFFINEYNTQWGSWSGFAVSNTRDTNEGKWSNQYSCISGGGVHNSTAYAVAYNSGEIVFAHSKLMDTVYGVSVNNSTYAYKTMLHGDAFAKKFGGKSGADPDSFIVRFSGFDTLGNSTGVVDFYLADFRSSDSTKDYIIKDWTWVDLTALGSVSTIKLSFNSSDRGQWGMNNPAYVCIDSLVKSSPASRFKPIARPDNFELPSNSSNNRLDVAKNDIDPNGADSGLAYSIVNNARFGSASISKEGILIYTPNKNFNNMDSINYKVCDSNNLCSEELALLLVNTAPIVNGESDSLVFGESSTLMLLANDEDEDKRNWQLNMLDSFKMGAFSLAPNGELNYTAGNIAGNDTATYQVCDKFGKCNKATVIFYVYEKVNWIQENGRSLVNIYPNPSNEIINVGYNTTEDLKLSLQGQNGQVIHLPKGQQKIDISQFPIGVYFLNVKSEKTQEVIKIIKIN